jgi:gibberellin 2-oxidase
MDVDPPFQQTYKTLLAKTTEGATDHKDVVDIIEKCELPLIDLGRLNLKNLEKEKCKSEIARASQEWGFFQVVNHGISREILDKMRSEQVKVFKQPFNEKSKEEKFLNFSRGTYRWGTPTATCLKQLSWSEAFHIPMSEIQVSNGFSSALR